jgi:pantetheine-phosphate adenylyltransferase
MTRAIYPATFDPITLGHVDIATRAAALFDELVVAVYDRPLKNLLFSSEERWQMTHDALAHLPNVRIERYTGLTVEFARQQRATVIVRGLRVLSDFEWEFQLALTNRNLAPDIDTVCLMTSQEYSFLSSSVVKEIAFAGGDIALLVPTHVIQALRTKIRELGGDGANKVKLVSLRD